MRVVAGKYRGKNLASPKDDRVRPTTTRIKETLFNVLQGYSRDAVVLDLFAGSGALGIECISRGAKEVVFVDNSKDSIELWCSCCLRHGEIDILPRTMTTVEYELLYNKHNMHVTCPYCGARATYKNARKLGKKTRLPQYLPVVLLAEKNGDLYARAYWTRKT